MKIFIHFCILLVMHTIRITMASTELYEDRANDIQYGVILVNSRITRKTKISFGCCARACVDIVRCRSINYVRSMQLCDINHKELYSDGNGKRFKQGLYAKKNAWMWDLCEDLESIGNTIDCGFPDNITNAVINVGHGTGLHSKAIYSCIDDNYVSEGNPQISCMENGTWSYGGFRCNSYCAKDWTRLNNKCYKKGGSASFQTAISRCATLDSTVSQPIKLAESTSLEENNFIVSLTKATTLISGTDEDNEGVWVYHSDNRNMIWFNWENGEPNGGTSQNCIMMRATGVWVDVQCYKSYRYVCQYTR